MPGGEGVSRKGRAKTDDRLIFLLGHARHRVYLRLDQALVERTGVTTAQVGALFFLQGHDGCLLSQMGQGLMLDKSAITGLVDRLEKKGMIERRKDPEDRRAIRLHLTRRGRDAAARALPVVKEQNAAIKQGFTAEEIEVFSRVLQSVIERTGGGSQNDSSLPRRRP
jgi:DNA-binding MarR family transcriptional regulator